MPAEVATQPSRSESLRPSQLRAIGIALDELEAYHSVIGAEDPSHESQAWAIKILRNLLHEQAAEQHDGEDSQARKGSVSSA